MKKFVADLKEKYEKTTDGNWFHKSKYGLGMTNEVVLTDKEQAMTGFLVGSFGEFGSHNAEFLVFVHNNMYRIFELIEQCELIQRWHQRGIMGEPNRALWGKAQPIPDGWMREDRVPEVDGFVPIKKIEK